MLRQTLTILGLACLAACAGPSTSASSWTPLFNGRDLDGWTAKIVGHEAGENLAETFRVEAGLLRVVYDGYERFDGRFGHLFYTTPFSHYRLRLEYRFTGDPVPGAPGWAFRNSGVMVHGQTPESMGLDQEFPVSIEVQFLGGDGAAPRSTANLCTPGTHVVIDGELERRHCIPSTSATFHGDRWVTVEVEVRGHERIEHFVNRESVLVYSKPQLDLDDADARRLGREDAALDAGTISIQSEGHAIDFRRIEVRPLAAGE